MAQSNIRVLFLDIGGVLLTNGWDTAAREKAISTFSLDATEFEKRHGMAFDSFERGRMSLDTYLDLTLFYTARPFTREEFRSFMFDASQPLPGAMEFFRDFRQKNDLRVAALSNEPRELNAHRIKKFDLDSLFDFFISSCYIDKRKPEENMYRMACDIAAVQPQESLYIDDREYYMPMAQKVGLQCLHHTSIEETRDKLKDFGFKI